MHTDILIIGNGIAALSLVYHLVEMGLDKKIIVLSECTTKNSNSYLAQGGVAVEFGGVENKNKHIDDTILCGVINNKSNTKIILSEAENSITRIIDSGLIFDNDKEGHYLRRLEGGHSSRRILYHSDTSGKHISDFLLQKVKSNKKITLLQNRFCFELVKQDDSCVGANVYNTKKNMIETIFASKTILATGGAAALYKNTSNSDYSIGAGVTLAKDIGAKITNIEFIQFHPTGFRSGKKSILLSEALRGEGAIIVNKDGRKLEGVELLTRDKLSRILYDGIKQGEEYFLDCTMLSDEVLNQFEYVRNSLRNCKLDLKVTPIPIVPVAHYMCGGIATNVNGKTNINNLYAIGETADTGLHGANRLASNSLTEAITVPYLLTFELIKSDWNKIDNKKDYYYEIDTAKDYSLKIESLRELMWQKCGIVRKDNLLIELLDYIKSELRELGNDSMICYSKLRYISMLKTAKLIVAASIKRTENVGTFFKY